MSKLNLAPNECSCTTCQQMCRRPCWGTPEDIKRLIDAGFGGRLMVDYWGSSEDMTYILCPAVKGYECNKAPFIPRTDKGCTFWTNKLCDLHASGMKPIEGKLASCKPSLLSTNDEVELHEEIYLTWKNPEAQQFVEEWKAKYMTEEIADDPIYSFLELLHGTTDALDALPEGVKR